MNIEKLKPHFNLIPRELLRRMSEDDFKNLDKEIFEYAFLLTGAKSHNSIMIGDSYEADIEGAKTVNMDQVYFNPNKIEHLGTTTFEITCLSEIKNIL